MAQANQGRGRARWNGEDQIGSRRSELVGSRGNGSSLSRSSRSSWQAPSLPYATTSFEATPKGQHWCPLWTMWALVGTSEAHTAWSEHLDGIPPLPRSMLATIDFVCHYLRVAEFGPVEIRVESLRRTKRAESLRVTVVQKDMPLLEGLVWTVAELAGIDHDAAPMPEVPPAEDVETMGCVLAGRRATVPVLAQLRCPAGYPPPLGVGTSHSPKVVGMGTAERMPSSGGSIRGRGADAGGCPMRPCIRPRRWPTRASFLTSPPAWTLRCHSMGRMAIPIGS